MKKATVCLLGGMCVAMLLSGCSSGSAPMAKLSETYAEIAENNQKLFDAYEAVYQAEGKSQEKLMKKASSVAEDVKKANERLAKKASGQGERLSKEEITAEASPALGIKVKKGAFRAVQTSEAMALIVVEVPYDGVIDSQFAYLFLTDKKGKILTPYMGSVTDHNTLTVTLHVTSAKGVDDAAKDNDLIAKIGKLVFVTKAEYDSGEIFSKKEAARLKEEAETVEVDGVKIRLGGDLRKTLDKFPTRDLYWGYNEDYGLSVTVGNVWILIDEGSLTSKGRDVLDAYDMESDLKFSVKYIDRSAKITNFKVQ